MMDAPFGGFWRSFIEEIIRFLKMLAKIICDEFRRFLRKKIDMSLEQTKTFIHEDDTKVDNKENAQPQQSGEEKQRKQIVTPGLRKCVTVFLCLFFVKIILSQPPVGYTHQLNTNTVQGILLIFYDKDSTRFPLNSLLTGTYDPAFILDIDSAMKKRLPDIWNIYQGKLSIVVPPRASVRIKLPDETSVFLDAGSTLDFFKSDDNISREIFLKGQASFIILPHLGKSPTVRCGNKDNGEIIITAIRASFYIRAYQGGASRISLVRDSAWITTKYKDKTTKAIALKKGKEASLKEGMISTRQFNAAMLLALEKENKYMFNAEALSEVLKTAQEVYGTCIVIDEEEIAKHQYTGSFDKDNSLDYFMERLCKSEDLAYGYDRNGIIHVRKSG